LLRASRKRHAAQTKQSAWPARWRRWRDIAEPSRSRVPATLPWATSIGISNYSARSTRSPPMSAGRTILLRLSKIVRRFSGGGYQLSRSWSFLGQSPQMAAGTRGDPAQVSQHERPLAHTALARDYVQYRARHQRRSASQAREVPGQRGTIPDTQQGFPCASGTPDFSQQRATGPWKPART